MAGKPAPSAATYADLAELPFAKPYFEIAPDWACEVLSPSDRSDRP